MKIHDILVSIDTCRSDIIKLKYIHWIGEDIVTLNFPFINFKTMLKFKQAALRLT